MGKVSRSRVPNPVPALPRHVRILNASWDPRKPTDDPGSDRHLTDKKTPTSQEVPKHTYVAEILQRLSPAQREISQSHFETTSRPGLESLFVQAYARTRAANEPELDGVLARMADESCGGLQPLARWAYRHVHHWTTPKGYHSMTRDISSLHRDALVCGISAEMGGILDEADKRVAMEELKRRQHSVMEMILTTTRPARDRVLARSEFPEARARFADGAATLRAVGCYYARDAEQERTQATIWAIQKSLDGLSLIL